MSFHGAAHVVIFVLCSKGTSDEESVCGSDSLRVILMWDIPSFSCLQVSLLVLLCALLVKTNTFHVLVNHVFSAQINRSTPSGNHHTHQPDVDDGTTAAPPPAREDSDIDLPHSNGVKGESNGDRQGEKGRDHGNDRLDMYWNKLVSELNETEMGVVSRRETDGFAQMCEGQELCWRPMVTTHWPRLLNYTGYSTEGR